MLIFLDFDGVLRRQQAPLYRLEPELVARLEEALRALPTARVVITSSWREAFSLSEMREHFSPDIAERVIGATPMSQGHDGFYRHSEVLAYLKRHGGAEQPWVALDDDPEHYPPATPVVLVDPSVGFNADAASRLAQLAEEQQRNAR